MNRKNNSKTKSQSKARNTQRRRGSRRITGGMKTSAPIAVSDDLQQYVKFAAGRNGSRLRVEALIPLVQICSNSYDADDGLILGSLYNNLAQYPDLALTGTTMLYDQSGAGNTEVDYLSPVYKLIGSAFVRYNILECCFCYQPQSTTTVEDRLVFAFAEDPSHPLLRTVGVPTQDNLLALSESVAFAPWRSWTLDVSKNIKQDLLYTYQTGSDSPLNRFVSFGLMSCIASVEPTSTTAVTVYGILYGKLCLEFVEFCPIVRDFEPITTLAKPVRPRRVKECHVDCEESEECADSAKKNNSSKDSAGNQPTTVGKKIAKH